MWERFFLLFSSRATRGVTKSYKNNFHMKTEAIFNKLILIFTEELATRQFLDLCLKVEVIWSVGDFRKTHKNIFTHNEESKRRKQTKWNKKFDDLWFVHDLFVWSGMWEWADFAIDFPETCSCNSEHFQSQIKPEKLKIVVILFDVKKYF